MSRRRRSISSSRYRISRASVGSDSRNTRSFFKNGSSAAGSPSVSRSRLLDIPLPSRLPAPDSAISRRWGIHRFARAYAGGTCLQFFKFLQCRRYTAAIDSGRICPPQKARWDAKTPIPFNVRIALIGLIFSAPVGVRTKRSLRRSARTVAVACVSTQPTANDIAGGRPRSDSAGAGFNDCSFCISE